MCPPAPQNDAGEVSTTPTSKEQAMLSHHIVTALVAQREAEIQHRAEQARLRRPEPWGAASDAAGTRSRTVRRARRGRRRHLRLV
jgi:hypothetical protein